MMEAGAIDRGRFETLRSRRRSVLPPSFFLKLRFKAAGNGERRLAAAILEDAIRSFQDTFPARVYADWQLHWETDAWLNGQDGDQLFCFYNVCSILGVEPDSVRTALYAWRQKQLSSTMGQVTARRSVPAPSPRLGASDGEAIPITSWMRTRMPATGTA
jgi:hypothetical protein